uniref:Uncharacterized protein n=1 Tax=Anguilla anguilla TaxID=7936 RepID=A0A0E9QEC2_ANGAN
MWRPSDSLYIISCYLCIWTKVDNVTVWTVCNCIIMHDRAAFVNY